MSEKFYKKNRTWIASVLGSLVAVFLFALVVYGTTTIGDNINTDGNLDVNGRASTTNATTTGYLYVGQDITEATGWDFGIGDLLVTDDMFVNSQATTSASHWVGSGGTPNNLDLASGDLFVQGDSEIDGVLYLNRATSTSATTTSYLYVGADATEPSGWDFSLGDLFVTDDVFINDRATTSAVHWIGPAGTTNYLDVSGGDLYVQDDVEIDGTATGTALYLSSDLSVIGQASTTGDLFVTGGTFSLSTGTATTSEGLYVGSTGTGRSTTTVGIGTDKIDGCIELTKNGLYFKVWVDPAGTPTLVVAAGRCKD